MPGLDPGTAFGGVFQDKWGLCLKAIHDFILLFFFFLLRITWESFVRDDYLGLII